MLIGFLTESKKVMEGMEVLAAGMVIVQASVELTEGTVKELTPERAKEQRQKNLEPGDYILPAGMVVNSLV